MRQRKGSGLKYEYKRTEKWIKKISNVEKIPGGVWLPISIVAQQTNYSVAMIRTLCMNKVVKAIKFPVGPVLVNYNDVKNNWINT